MNHALSVLCLILAAAALTGCDEAKQRAQDLTDKAKHAVDDARNAVDPGSVKPEAEQPTEEEMVTEFVTPPFPVTKSLTGLRFAWFDRTGVHQAQTRDAIPVAARGRVQIAPTTTSDEKFLHGKKLYVADLRTPLGDSYPVQRVNRHLFDIWVSEVTGGPVKDTTKPGADDDGAHATGTSKVGPVILYRPANCSDCADAVTYLRKHGASYEDKDATDPTVAKELGRKVGRAGLGSHGLVTLDVGGTLVQGFDEARLNRIFEADEVKKSAADDKGWNRGLFDVDRPSKPHFQ